MKALLEKAVAGRRKRTLVEVASVASLLVVASAVVLLLRWQYKRGVPAVENHVEQAQKPVSETPPQSKPTIKSPRASKIEKSQPEPQTPAEGKPRPEPPPAPGVSLSAKSGTAPQVEPDRPANQLEQPPERLQNQPVDLRNNVQTSRLRNYEMAVQKDSQDEGSFIVSVFWNGRKAYAGESRLMVPTAVTKNRLPFSDCQSMLAHLYSGGAHCCLTALLCTYCPGNESAVEMRALEWTGDFICRCGQEWNKRDQGDGLVF